MYTDIFIERKFSQLGYKFEENNQNEYSVFIHFRHLLLLKFKFKENKFRSANERYEQK